MSDGRIVAAFDFDGTLTTGDSLLPFLLYNAGRVKGTAKLLRALPDLLGFCLCLKTRQEVKEAILAAFFAGHAIRTLREQGERFAREELPKMEVAAGMQRVRWHQEQGHRCVLISASLDIYLAPWAKQAGFDDLLCSRPQVDERGCFTGKLAGLNCWGPEKQRRLEELLGPREGYQLYAYGDSRGDQELLSYATYPFYRTFQGGADATH
jgi:phosphatidylglycerophosphatase C